MSNRPSPSIKPASAPTSAHTYDGERRRVVAEQSHEIESRGGVAVGVRWVAIRPRQPATALREELRRLDDVAFNPAGHADDLAHPPRAGRVQPEVHHEVDAR